MKTLYLITLLTISTLLNAQELPKLNLTNKGVSPIIINVDSTNAQQLYKRSLDWINDVYKNPKSVVKADITNEKLRVNGVAKNAYFFKSLGMKTEFDIEYTLDLEFKDNRFRLTYTVESVYFSNEKSSFPYNEYFNNEGELRKSYKDVKPSLEKTMNDLVLSIYDFIKKPKTDW
jgi:hypothetical protein